MTAIRHLVLFRLRSTEPDARRDDVAGMRTRLEGLVGVVPGLDSLVVRPDVGDEGHWDVALVSEHASRDALADYQRHPAHQEAVAWVSTVVAERATVDHEI